MKTAWTKPELYVENYELTQVVAAGCGTIITEIEKDALVTMGCDKSGSGHWEWAGTYEELLGFGDTNGDGNVDWSEFKNAVGSAKNGVETGGGHENHGTVITIDKVIIKEDDKPFNS